MSLNLSMLTNTMHQTHGHQQSPHKRQSKVIGPVKTLLPKEYFSLHSTSQSKKISP